MSFELTDLQTLCASIEPVDAGAHAAAQRELDQKTKPRRSLGELEQLACALCAIYGGLPRLPLAKTVVVMVADHGVAEESVSAYPQAVTAQMLLNFASGGAAINVLARHAGARVVVVDMGVRGELPALPEVRSQRIAEGTANFTRGPAMTRAQALAAIGAGSALALELARSGTQLYAIGEMGIGNSTAASALTSILTGAAPDAVVGRGTGIDQQGLARKLAAITRALAVNAPDPSDALDSLAKLGGFEIAGLCGVVLGAAAARKPILMDGFIASTAALCAARLAPQATGYLIASHCSVEPGHVRVLQALGKRPLLDLELRLGEGTGAALAFGLAEAALRLLAEMATFASAGVSDSGA